MKKHNEIIDRLKKIKEKINQQNKNMQLVKEKKINNFKTAQNHK